MRNDSISVSIAVSLFCEDAGRPVKRHAGGFVAAEQKDHHGSPRISRCHVQGESIVGEYIYLVRPQRATSAADTSEREATLVAAHLDYLQNLMAQGRLILAGRTSGAEFGIVVFTAEDDEHADDTVHSDPAVYEGLFSADCYPFRVTFLVERT